MKIDPYLKESFITTLKYVGIIVAAALVLLLGVLLTVLTKGYILFVLTFLGAWAMVHSNQKEDRRSKETYKFY